MTQQEKVARIELRRMLKAGSTIDLSVIKTQIRRSVQSLRTEVASIISDRISEDIKKSPVKSRIDKHIPVRCLRKIIKTIDSQFIKSPGISLVDI